MFQQFKDKKQYCPYFRYMSMFAAVSLVMLLASLAYSKKFDISAVPAIGSLLILYFQNRLFYTMCLD